MTRCADSNNQRDLVIDQYADDVAALLGAALEGPGSTDPATREVAFRGVDVHRPWDAYVKAVHEASYRITDADFAALSTAGCSEEAIFEMTLASALGAAARRLEAGLRALRAAEGD